MKSTEQRCAIRHSQTYSRAGCAPPLAPPVNGGRTNSLPVDGEGRGGGLRLVDSASIGLRISCLLRLRGIKTCFLLLTCGVLAVAQAPVDVSVTVDAPVIPFHRQTRFTITVEAPENAEITLPQMADKFVGLNVYGQPDFTIEPLPDGRKRIAETYTLDPVFTGVYPIAPVTVNVNGENEITVPSPAIRVRDLTEEEEQGAMQFVENAGPVDVERPLLQRWEIWAVLTVATALALVILFYVLRHRRIVERLSPPPPSWEIAYARLRDLDARNWPGQGRIQPYYVELSSILRHYIEDRLTLHAPEMTTPEFLAEASKSGALSADHQELLAHFLRHCDRVKFAQFRPTTGDMERSFAEVLRFVDETVPKSDDRKEAAA